MKLWQYYKFSKNGEEIYCVRKYERIGRKEKAIAPTTRFKDFFLVKSLKTRLGTFGHTA
jgi:hypothetical protein